MVVAREEADSYLRDFESERTFGYAVIDGQVVTQTASVDAPDQG